MKSIAAALIALAVWAGAHAAWSACTQATARAAQSQADRWGANPV